jgi:hypothetical protein
MNVLVDLCSGRFRGTRAKPAHQDVRGRSPRTGRHLAVASAARAQAVACAPKALKAFNRLSRLT